MAKSKLTATVRELIKSIDGQDKITLRSYDAKRQLVKGTISADAPVRFDPEVISYARSIIARDENSQITVNDRKIILDLKSWSHVAGSPEALPLLKAKSTTDVAPTDVAARPSDPTDVAPVDAADRPGPPAERQSAAPEKITENKPAAFSRNQRIEELIDSKGKRRDDPDAYTEDEKAELATFAGYGGLEKYGEDKSGRGLLYEFYTPWEVVEIMWRLCVKHGYAGGSVLESSSGPGRFLRYAPKRAAITAYEINPTTATIVRVLYPHATVHNEPFEQMFIGSNNNTLGGKIDHLRTFDLAIGNPPYGKFESKEAGMGEAQYTKATNHIEYFIYRTLDVLKPGGLCCQLVGAEPATGGKRFLQSGMTTTKAKIKSMATLLEAHVLPEGVFERSSSIGEIIVFRKN